MQFVDRKVWRGRVLGRGLRFAQTPPSPHPPQAFSARATPLCGWLALRRPPPKKTNSPVPLGLKKQKYFSILIASTSLNCEAIIGDSLISSFFYTSEALSKKMSLHDFYDNYNLSKCSPYFYIIYCTLGAIYKNAVLFNYIV